MFSALAASYLAGLLTTLNPCVLPVLPIVLASAFVHGRAGVVALAGGMVVSFTVIGTLLAASGQVFGLSDTVIRNGAALLFVAFGLMLLMSGAQRALAGTLQPLADAASTLAASVSRFGLVGQALTGALLGIVWTPCAGPALGAAVTLAAQAGGLEQAMLRMFVFSLGAVTVLIALAFGSRAAVMARRDRLMALATRAKPAFGVLLVALGAMVLTGLDKRLEATLVDLMPAWLIAFTTSV